MDYSTSKIEFKLKDTPIDYYKLRKEDFENLGLVTTAREINLKDRDKPYLTIEDLDIDEAEKSTTIVNVQVGSGKTQVFYQLISHYAKNGFLVIVCSPFKKLIDKDCNALRTEYGLNVFDYRDIQIDQNSLDGLQVLFKKEPVQVMTINCLLGNSGAENIDQARIKKQYLEQLKAYALEENKQIVFFFDEIHAAIENFKQEYLPNLISWHGTKVHKCFVASATFTPASIYPLNIIALLTDKKIKICEASRFKTKTQASLFLHIIDEPFNGKNLYPINSLKDLLIHHHKEKDKINILTGMKAIGVALCEKKIKTDAIDYSKILPNYINAHLTPNLLTGDDSENVFDTTKDNIGTTFKTGIDIKGENGVLIIIIPVIKYGDKKYSQYGIFSDGIAGIIQSFARIREGGSLYVVLYKPSTFIKFEEYEKYLPEIFCSQLKESELLFLNNGYNQYLRRYNNIFLKQGENIKKLEEFNIQGAIEYQPPKFWIEANLKSTEYLRDKFESFGKDLSSYIVYAAINNQFCNATLKEISFRTKTVNVITLLKDKLRIQIYKMLTENHREKISEMSFREGVLEVLKSLETSNIIDEKTKETKITVNLYSYENLHKISVTKLRNVPDVMCAILDVVASIKDQSPITFTKDSYIPTCMYQAKNFYPNANPDLKKYYLELYNLLFEFKEVYEKELKRDSKNRIAISKNVYQKFDNNLILRIAKNIQAIQASDWIIGDKIISFMQHLPKTEVLSIDERQKKKIVDEIESLLFKVTTARTTVKEDKGKENYYILEDDYHMDKVDDSLKFALI